MKQREAFMKQYGLKKLYEYGSAEHPEDGQHFFRLSREEIAKIRSESPTFREIFDAPTELRPLRKNE